MIFGDALPKDIVDSWPEVFSDIKINVVPLIYIRTITILFKNHKIWEIKLKKSEKNHQGIQSQLNDIISEYASNIDHIDFKLDSNLIKKDISKKTHKFLKKKHLT